MINWQDRVYYRRRCLAPITPVIISLKDGGAGAFAPVLWIIECMCSEEERAIDVVRSWWQACNIRASAVCLDTGTEASIRRTRWSRTFCSR